MKLGFALLIAARLVAAPTDPEAVCATCHKAIYEAQRKTPMASALESVAECEILRTHPKLEFSDGRYTYRISRQGDASVYSVTDGNQSLTVPIAWAFGLGAAGQTYVFEHNGHMFESRVSYFREIDALDLTMGAAAARPANLEHAAGREMNEKDARECFACHATGATPGIHCQRCHQHALEHAASVQQTPTPKLTRLSVEEMSDFCGECHRTWAQIAAQGPFGIGNIRFQPYRLANSACFDAADHRISCTACHDPHGAKVVSYDTKCMSCHREKPCPVGKADCVSCHMPKLELPGSHHRFTDHQIRIARAGERYPN